MKDPEISKREYICKTDSEDSSSDESEVGFTQHRHYTRFRLRDHIKSFFKTQEGAQSGAKPGSKGVKQKRKHLVSCSATKMVIWNQHDIHVFRHLQEMNRIRRGYVVTYPSEWVAWMTRPEGKDVTREADFGAEPGFEESVKITKSEELCQVTSSLKGEFQAVKRTHIFRDGMSPADKESYSDSTIFMKVPSASSVKFFERVCETVLSDKLSQPLSIHGMCFKRVFFDPTNIQVPIIGISLSKATEEYAILILWLAENTGDAYHKSVYKMLQKLIAVSDERYKDVIESSVFVDNKSLEALEVFSEDP